MCESPRRVLIQTPAKINLGLRVLGKRPDGFHEIETLFVAVSLYDELTIERRETGGIQFTWEPGTANPFVGDVDASDHNLVVRAARAFARAADRSIHVAIRLVKNIPVAAGLGGGSSDAAATLAGLQRLYPERLNTQSICRLAEELGSDVPFFLGPPAALGRGRGELLTSTSINTTWCAILACQKHSSSTEQVYAALDLTSLPRMRHFPAGLEGDGFFAALALLHNDLQDVVERRIPEVLHWQKRLLSLGAEGAYVSGSGPTVFGVFRNEPDIGTLTAMREGPVDVFLVRPLDASPSMVIRCS